MLPPLQRVFSVNLFFVKCLKIVCRLISTYFFLGIYFQNIFCDICVKDIIKSHYYYKMFVIELAGKRWRLFGVLLLGTVEWAINMLLAGKINILRRHHIPFFNLINNVHSGLWWWSSGQRARLLLRQSEFKSRWGLQFFCKIVLEKNENKQKEAGVGPFFNNLHS